MPFDRLVRTVDDWVGASGRRDVFAQIGYSSFRPRHIEWAHFLEPEEFRAMAMRASVILAHAGTGSILTAMEYQKPILVMPRRAELRETRNDHQVATAERFRIVAGVSVAMNENELRERLRGLQKLERPHTIGPHASEQLISGVKDFLAKVAEPVQRKLHKINTHDVSGSPTSQASSASQ